MNVELYQLQLQLNVLPLVIKLLSCINHVNNETSIKSISGPQKSTVSSHVTLNNAKLSVSRQHISVKTHFSLSLSITMANQNYITAAWNWFSWWTQIGKNFEMYLNQCSCHENWKWWTIGYCYLTESWWENCIAWVIL